jgi:CelD/BcsL family acetyltransferase involved in cellulose biosynthesis
MIETIEDAAGFEKLRDEWDDLLEASASDCFFLTWEWLYPWWKHLSGDRSLRIVTLRSGGELVAIAPLASRPRRLARLAPFRSLEFIGADRVCSDYLDLIIRRGREPEALDALTEYLSRDMPMIKLANVRRTSLAAELATGLQRHGWSPSEETIAVCPFTILTGHSWQSYLATLGPEHRYNFRRRLRNVTKLANVQFEEARSPAQAQAMLHDLVAMHNMRWRDRGGSDAFDSPDLIAFHEEVTQLALDRGWLKLYTLTLDGRPAAALYGFHYRATFYFMQAGFDPRFRKHSVGLLTMGLAIKTAIDEGMDECDLLRGDEAYKFHWARERRELGRLELYPPRVSVRLYKRIQSVGRAGKTAVLRALPMVDRTTTTSRSDNDVRDLRALRH